MDIVVFRKIRNIWPSSFGEQSNSQYVISEILEVEIVKYLENCAIIIEFMF